MALWDEVVTRYSADRLVKLTNPEDATATSIDTNRSAAAVADAAAEFEVETGVAYDNTIARHVGAAVEGVVYYLMLRQGPMGSEGLTAQRDAWRQKLTGVSRTTGRNRIMPSTTSVYTPSVVDTSGGVVRPDFDRDSLTGLLIDQGSAERDNL